jgi:hypothetical protein
VIVRGLLVAASGFVFIFSPGLPMRLLMRGMGRLSFKREFVYWGIGAWIIALPPSLFVQSLLRQVLQGPQASRDRLAPLDYGLTLMSALLTALLVAGVMYLVLRRSRRTTPLEDLAPGGLALGFGAGLIAQVFTGLSLVGAGFQLMFGNVANETLSRLAQSSYLDLVLGLLPLILFRPALLVVSAARGVLVARGLVQGARYFWLAVIVDAVFVWALFALQLALGSETPGQVLVGSVAPMTAAVTCVYYVVAFGLAYAWVLRQISRWESVTVKGRGTRDARE